jgi:hypothetical protein
MNQKKELTWSSVKSEPEGRREQERGGIRRRQTDRRDIRKETFLADDFLYLRKRGIPESGDSQVMMTIARIVLTS